MKLCVNCKWCSDPKEPRYALCLRKPLVPEIINPVDGSKTKPRYADCSIERMRFGVKGECGPEGRNFEPIDNVVNFLQGGTVIEHDPNEKPRSPKRSLTQAILEFLK